MLVIIEESVAGGDSDLEVKLCDDGDGESVVSSNSKDHLFFNTHIFNLIPRNMCLVKYDDKWGLCKLCNCE